MASARAACSYCIFCFWLLIGFRFFCFWTAWVEPAFFPILILVLSTALFIYSPRFVIPTHKLPWPPCPQLPLFMLIHHIFASEFSALFKSIFIFYVWHPINKNTTCKKLAFSSMMNTIRPEVTLSVFLLNSLGFNFLALIFVLRGRTLLLRMFGALLRTLLG